MSVRQEALKEATSFAIFSAEARPRIEYALRQYLPLARTHDNAVFNAALQDAVFPSGKRFRAVLALLASELTLANDDDALTAAVAVEYLHSSALIFDDLPAMDDAHERRGRVCLHLRYGEGVAIVVALALMNASYDIVVSRTPCNTAAAHQAFHAMTQCVAAQITGQAADLTRADGAVRHWKTSGLLCLALTLGPILSGARSSDVAALNRFGQLLGEAYQTLDDSRDIGEDTALLLRGREATFAMEHGVESARKRAAELAAEAQRHLIAKFGDLAPMRRLCEFAMFLG